MATQGVTTSSNFRQLLDKEIDSQLGGAFSQLGDHPLSRKVVLGMICTESGSGLSWNNVNIQHAVLPAAYGIGKSYENHPVIKASRINPSTNQVNLNQGRQAHSLLGCLGAYLIRGLETGPASFPYVQAKYKQLAEAVGLLVNPGEPISALFPQNEEGLRRGLMAGLCILATNYANQLRKNPNDPSGALSMAVRLHLGDPTSRDSVTGISSSDYLARVMAYADAAGAKSPGAKFQEMAVNATRSAPVSSGVKNADGSVTRKAPGCGF